MKSKHRILSLLLAIVTILSLFPIQYIDIAHATSGAGNGLGSGDYVGGSKSGVWESDRVGVRIYIVEASSGKRVSNIVDILPSSIGGTNKQIAHFGTKVDPSSSYTEASSFQKLIGSKPDGVTILYKDTLLANAEYPEDCKYKLDASMPIPVVTESFKAHGKELLDYMLGHEGPDVVLWGATSGGGSGATDSNYADYDGQIAQEYGTVAEQVAVLRAQLEEIWSAYYKQYQSGGYDGKEVRNVITEKSSALFATLRDAMAEGENGPEPIYSTEEVAIFAATIEDFILECEQQIASSNPGSQDNSDNDSMDELSASNMIDSLFDIAYAAESESDGGMKPLWDNGKLMSLMDVRLWGKAMFYIEGIPLSTVNGKPSIMMTCAENDLVVMMEPVVQTRLQKTTTSYDTDKKKTVYVGGTATKFSFYGTPLDLGRFLQSEKGKKNGWTNVGASSAGDGNGGGWIARGSHITLPWSMFTDTDLTIGSQTITSGDVLRLSHTKQFKSGGKVIADTWLQDDQMANPNLGFGLHYYRFKISELPSTQTYDNFPEGKPNSTPHPAPDPDPNANIIPLKPKEDPERYKETTRTVNIVKVYDTLLLDEDDAGNRILRHDYTYTRTNNPGDIKILHEPQYKVVGYFTSKDYYGDIMGWEANPDLVNPTEWAELQGVITDKTEGTDWDYETVSEAEEGSPIKQSPVKLALYCDCKNAGKMDAIDGEHGTHYHDNTLYVHLVKPETIPETSTWDGTPPGETPPPNPFKKPQTDPETTPDLTPDNPFLIHEIVKVYQVKDWSDWQEGMPEPEWEHKATFYQYPTAPIVTVENEEDYQLTEWKVAVGVPNPDDKATEITTPPVNSGTDWEDPPISTVNPFKQGVQPAKVDIRDPIDKKHNTTIYVLLRKEIPPEDEDVGDGAIIIQQSQITKSVRTNDKAIANQGSTNWGNYSFHYQVGDFSDSPDSHGHSHGLAGYHRCYHIGNELWVDQDLCLWFHQLTDKQDIQVPDGKYSKTDNAVYSGNSNQGIIHKRDERITINTIQKYDYVGDGTNAKGEELVTVLWRQGINDKPILASYKQNDITSGHGYILKGVSATNWTDSLAIVDKADRKAGNGRQVDNGFIITNLTFDFGIIQGEGDQHGATKCPGCTCHGCHAPIVRDRYVSVTSGNWAETFTAPVCVRTYKGREKDVAAEPYGVGAQPVKDIKTAKHGANNVIQGKQQIKFYPYIRMTYMINSLDDATKEAQNTDNTGYKQDVRKDTYIISEYESSILPNDAVNVEWSNPKDGESLLLTSQQWSVHQKAVSGSDGWQGKNQVLPGGAIYQLSTPNGSRTMVNLTTYQTVVDEKARAEYLTSTSTLTGDEYTVKKVTEDHLSFVNDAKEILDNLKVVQWVHNPGNSSVLNGKTVSNTFGSNTNAYPKKFDETKGGYICLFHNGVPRDDSQTKLSQLDKNLTRTPATDSKYYMHAANVITNSNGTLSTTGTLADYQNSTKLSDITSTLIKGDAKQSEATQGDLDILKIYQTTTVYKVFTDTSGNVYMISDKREGTSHIDQVEADINAMIASMKDINADTYDKWSAGGSKTAEVLVDKTIQAIDVNKKLSGDAKEIDDRTRFITNIVTSITRNRGVDKTAEWVNGPTEGRWYNEGFDGIYLVKQETRMEIGFGYTDTRQSALDPALDPPNKGQSDLYTNAYLSQFTVDSHSDATIAAGKPDHYIGTFKDTDILLPDMESMYISKKFYIPNANVQDLN